MDNDIVEVKTKGRATSPSREVGEIFKNLINEKKFVELYSKWESYTPAIKEQILLRFTLLPTPTDWISSYQVKGKDIRYIKGFIAKRILNLLFGIGNWTIELEKMGSEDNDRSYVSYGYGYLVIKWFDGSTRKIPTAGSGNLSKNNGMVAKGDDMKAVISDMIKKALANMGFFADLYSGVEAVEDNKGEDKREELKPQFSYMELKRAVDLLKKDYLEGIDVADRVTKARALLVKMGYNDLLVTINELK